MAHLQIHQFPTRSDNYGVLVHDPATGATAAIDAPDAEELLAALHEKGWALSHILTTHHHHDHTAGNTIVKRMTGCTIVGPAKEAGSIPGIDVEVKDGDTVEIGSAKAQRDRDAGPHQGSCQLLFSRRRARLRRRHAVLGRLRQAARGRRQDDVVFAEEARWPAARDQALLRPRIHQQQLPLRAHRRAGERRAPGARRAKSPHLPRRASRRCRPRSRRSLPPIRSSGRRAPPSRSGSAWRGASCGRSSARSGAARTGSNAPCPLHRRGGDQAARAQAASGRRLVPRDVPRRAGPHGRAFTAILFLLKAGEVSRWHKVDAAELWHWHGGAPLLLE